MSGTGDDEKEAQKSLPLDLARNQITTVRAVDGKAPLLMTGGQSLRGMRVLAQGTVPSSGNAHVGGSTIITTNIVPQAVLKQDVGRTQITNLITSSQAQTQSSGSITIQRPTQITLSTTPVVAQNVASGTTYHVPRGAAVVANLAAPRSSVTTVRTPMVVAQTALQVHSFVRPPRTPSPAQGTAWLTTNASNGSQIKGAPTVLSSPVRGATVTGKPQLVTRAQPAGQTVSGIRQGTILHSAITIGQTGSLHSFKPGQAASGIQSLGNAVTITQVLPSRTQAVVYSANTSAQFATNPRLTVSSTAQAQRQTQITRPVGQASAPRLPMPVTVAQSATRLITPQATVLSAGARIANVTTLSQQQSQHSGAVISGPTPARIVSNTPTNVTLGRLSVAATPAQVTTANILGQPRISTLSLQPLVPVGAAGRGIQTQGAKVITQLTPIQGSTIKTTQTTGVAAPTRTMTIPTAMVTQRQTTLPVPISKVYPQQPDGQQGSTAPTSGANVFIHAANVSTLPKRTSPSLTSVAQTNSTTVATTTVATYSLPTGTYFYDANYARNFSHTSTPFTTVERQTQAQPLTSLSQVHGIVNQPMRFNTVMVVEQNRGQQFSSQVQGNSEVSEQPLQASLPTKVTSSPRPSILRKRDHEGSPLKASKNLSAVLTSLPSNQQPPQPPASPPSRPDSRGNGHSSEGGSTTISATSSPGIPELNDDSMPEAPAIKKEEEDTKPPMEMSPRKKPRKQQLTGNDLDEHNDDMQFISESIKKEEDSDENQTDEPRDGAPEARQIATVRKPATASLLNSYRHNWKATHNHYLRYSDVRPKDERRPTIMDLANQYRVQEKVNGWKIYHLSTQMEDLAEQEQSVYDQLKNLLKCTESEESANLNKEVNRVNELIKGNLQRIKIINDGMVEAKTQIMKIFDHKVHVTDIINRCASKRNFKKREKS